MVGVRWGGAGPAMAPGGASTDVPDDAAPSHDNLRADPVSGPGLGDAGDSLDRLDNPDVEVAAGRPPDVGGKG